MAPRSFNKLKDRHILVIGGSMGIGHAVAEGALAAGARVTISSSSQARLDSAAASFAEDYPGCQVRGIACDLAQPDEVLEGALEELFKATHAAHGQVHHVVLTATQELPLVPLKEVNWTHVHAAAHMRAVVPLLLAKVAARYMPRQTPCSLTLTTGTVAEKPPKDWAVLAFMGGGLISLTKALAVELAPMRVNIVRPGAVDTPLWKHFSAEEKAAFEKAMKEKMLTGKMGRPQDVAEAYLWLMKDENVTGTVAGSDSGGLIV